MIYFILRTYIRQEVCQSRRLREKLSLAVGLAGANLAEILRAKRSKPISRA